MVLNKLEKARLLQKKIKNLKEKGKSVREIAKRLNISIGTVSNYLNDNIPSYVSKSSKNNKKTKLTEAQKLKNRNRQYK